VETILEIDSQDSPHIFCFIDLLEPEFMVTMQVARCAPLCGVICCHSCGLSSLRVFLTTPVAWIHDCHWMLTLVDVNGSMGGSSVLRTARRQRYSARFWALDDGRSRISADHVIL
jgi:hypothetical protein